MIFQSSMGLGKSRCDVPNGNVQEWACPFSVIKKSSMDSGAWRWFDNITPRMYETWEVISIFFLNYMRKEKIYNNFSKLIKL
jgi:hypothetical protein